MTPETEVKLKKQIFFTELQALIKAHREFVPFGILSQMLLMLGGAMAYEACEFDEEKTGEFCAAFTMEGAQFISEIRQKLNMEKGT